MKILGMLGVGLVLLMGSPLLAPAQVMGDEKKMTAMTDMGSRAPDEPAASECPGMAGHALAFGDEGPWISFALAHAKEIDLTPEQVKGLTGLREEFQKEAIRLSDQIRTAEADVRTLLSGEPVDLHALEAKIRAIEGLETELRLGRVKTLGKGRALVTTEQRAKLTGIAQADGPTHGVLMMGGSER